MSSKELIKFSFSPKEQSSFMQTLTVLREKDMGKMGKQIDESKSTTKIKITKTKDGWDILAEPISRSMKRNGKETKNPISSLLSSVTITYKLDSTGNIKDIEGYENLVEQMKKQFPPEVFKQLSPIFNVESLKAKDIAEYNGRIGDYLGAEVEVGDSFISSVPFSFPNGTTVNYNIKTDISAIESCEMHNCVRINQVYDSNADAIAKKAIDVVNNVTKVVTPEMKQLGLTHNTASIQGTVSRLIDPSTMLIYEEEIRRIIKIELNIPNAGFVPVKTTERRLYKFDFN